MPKTLTLISLGSRGVGKTVFLTSNCAEIFRSRLKKRKSQNAWFECQDPETQQKIEKLLEFIIRTQQYPPATFKISNFCLTLKRKELGRVRTVCNLQWLDIPGEWCSLNNKQFQSALFQSHGCCVFVDTYALLHEATYLKTLKQTINQVEAITSLVDKNQLIKYPIALICTKYDLIDSSPIGLIQLEEKLHPLIHRIESSQSVYKRFYSSIPLINQKNGEILAIEDANAPLLWMASQLRKIHRSKESTSLGMEVESVLASHDSPTQIKKLDSPFSVPGSKKTILIILASCGIVAGITALSLMLGPRPKSAAVASAEQEIKAFNEVLQRDANNVKAIAGIVDTYSRLGQYERAISRLQDLRKNSPGNIHILTELVDLYRVTGQNSQLEQSYDQILALEKDNMLALLGKAQLKVDNGYLDEARELYDLAQKYAPTSSLKAEIQELSQKTLEVQ